MTAALLFTPRVVLGKSFPQPNLSFPRWSKRKGGLDEPRNPLAPSSMSGRAQVFPAHLGLSRAASPSLPAHPVLDLQVREPHPIALAQGHHGAFNGLGGKETKVQASAGPQSTEGWRAG